MILSINPQRGHGKSRPKNDFIFRSGDDHIIQSLMKHNTHKQLAERIKDRDKHASIKRIIHTERWKHKRRTAMV